MTGIIHFFYSAYENFIIMGDFNAQPLDGTMKDFIKVSVLINLKEIPALKDRALALI